jgi:hypothetical protein
MDARRRRREKTKDVLSIMYGSMCMCMRMVIDGSRVCWLGLLLESPNLSTLPFGGFPTKSHGLDRPDQARADQGEA